MALVLLALEVATRTVIPTVPEQPSADLAARTLYPYRGWLEYVSGRTPDGQRLAVLIGSSQAVGPEIRDENTIFASRLRQALRGQGVHLENWGVNGLRTYQLELLSMQAVARGAELVIVMLSANHLDQPQSLRVGAHTADIDLLVGEPRLWPMLAGSVAGARLDAHDRVRHVLARWSTLFRSRELVSDLVAVRLPPSLHRFAFGHPRTRDARRPVNAPPVRSRGGLFGAIAGLPTATTLEPHTVEYWRDDLQRWRIPTFEAIYPGLRDRLRAGGAELLWIWMPLQYSGLEETAMVAAAPVQAEMCARIRADGGHCADLTMAVPPEDFVTLGIASHLNADGHARVAELLLPLLRDALH